MSTDRTKADDGENLSLEGHLLIATPTIGDPRFERSVIYMCAHSRSGAMGIRVNRQSRRVNFPELLVQLEVIAADDAIRLPPNVSQVPVLRGGPVEARARLRAAFAGFLRRRCRSTSPMAWR